MLGKTLILGLISAGAAGAIVYYGTAPQGSEALEVHPHDSASVEKSDKNARKTIEPRLPTVRKAEAEDGRQKLASGSGLPETEAELVPSPKTSSETSNKTPQKQTRWLDQYLKKNKSDEVADDGDDMSDASKGGADSATNSYTVNERAAIDDIEPDTLPMDDSADVPAVTDPRTFRIEDGKLVEVSPVENVTDEDDMAQMNEAREASHIADKMMAEEEGRKSAPYKFKTDTMAMANDSTPLLSTVMREAAEIKKPELRDQAYFEITEYALSEGRYDSARMAHDMIEQDELSYTAKSRIAVAYAQNGQPTKAFKVIGEVDEAELRDFMRLQVIEALIAPQNLPQTWQENTN